MLLGIVGNGELFFITILLLQPNYIGDVEAN